MAPKFGTSGLRGLVSELTAELVADYTRAFVAACECGGTLYVGRDLRASSPAIAQFVIDAALSEGLDVVDCGALATPALALASLTAGAGAVMVTGSHIPADRNGLKFYVPTGEISKTDEQAIMAHLGRPATHHTTATLHTGTQAEPAFRQRYVTAFGPEALRGLRLGIYQHSAVARDTMMEVVRALGAEAIALGRSDVFLPVDTEALDPDTRGVLAGWCAEHGLDAVLSTDGDSDRPMLADRHGSVIAGDVLGALSARHLGATHICTPVSSNSMVLQMPCFDHVALTQIGSPFVIAAMEEALARTPAVKVAGYEANGGFLLGFHAQLAHGPLAPLMTRDSLLPMLAPLVAARAQNRDLADLVADLPAVFTAADRLQGVAQTASQPFLARLVSDAGARAAFFAETFTDAGPERDVNTTDGLRVTFQSGDIIHLRPSGNAPEFRCYAEADSLDKARALVAQGLVQLRAVLC